MDGSDAVVRPASEYPTELELMILKTLWDQPPMPVRSVRQALADSGRDAAHTSVITTLNTMVRKKYLRRTRQGNSLFFTPRVTRQEVSERMLGDVVERVFEGSPTALMMSLFNCADIDEEELKSLRRLLGRKMKDHTS